MNRGLWVVLLNALMRTEGGDWPAIPEPAASFAAHDGTWSRSRAGNAASSINEAGDQGRVSQPSIEGPDLAESAEATEELTHESAVLSRDAGNRSNENQADTGGTFAGELER